MKMGGHGIIREEKGRERKITSVAGKPSVTCYSNDGVANTEC